MLAIQEMIIKHHKILDAVRIMRNSEASVETLKDYLRISRTTADREISPLLNEGISCKNNEVDNNTVSLVKKIDRKFVINKELCFFLGVSIGSTQIKVVLLRLDFSSVDNNEVENILGFDHIGLLEKELGLGNITEAKENDKTSKPYHCYSFPTPPKIEKIRKLVNDILKPMIDRHNSYSIHRNDVKVPFHLLGIGFSVSGPVNYIKNEWSYAPRIDFWEQGMRGVILKDLLGFEIYSRIIENKIFLSIDNNAKAAMVSEYQYILEQKQGNFYKDLAILYVGAGIGMAAVIGRKLLRGEKNYAGEVGDLRIKIDKRSDCDSFSNRIEDQIVFDDEEKPNPDDYITYIPYIMNAIACITGIENVIIVGHNATENWIPALLDRRLNFTLKSTSRYCGVETGRGKACTAAIGAAIQAYFSMCNFNLEEEFTEKNSINLALDISW
jgi:predicted NBD/HSP70 family sugar kinase